MWRRFYLILCFLLIIAAPVLSQKNWVKFSYFKNWGGLNDTLSNTDIEDNEATDIQNIVFDVGGSIKKRFGFKTIPRNPAVQVVTNATGIPGLAFYKQNDGTKHIVGIANVNGQATAFKKTYSSGGAIPTGAWDSIQFASLPSSYTNNQLASFTVGEDKLVICLPSTTPTKPFVWTGTGNVSNLTADADAPNSSVCVFHKNILFLAGDTSQPSRLYFSDLDNGITAFVSTDFIDISTSDGSRIRGLVSANDSLYIFKDFSIWRLSGNDRDSFILEKMVDKVGSLSHQSIQNVNGLIYFTTANSDIAVYDGNYTVKFISQNIRNTIGALNFTRASTAIGLAFSTYKYANFDYYVGLSNAGSGTNNRVLLFDTQFNAWSKFVGINPNSWTVAENDVGQNIMVWGDYSGYVHYYPSDSYFDGDVSTSAISAYWQTKWFKYEDVGKGDKYARILKTYALSESSDSILYVDYRTDYESTGKVFTIDLEQSGALWDEAVWDVDTWSGQSLIVDREEINKGVNLFQIKFYNETVNQGFTIFGYDNYLEGTDRI